LLVWVFLLRYLYKGRICLLVPFLPLAIFILYIAISFIGGSRYEP
jgi:hypothetical protein